MDVFFSLFRILELSGYDDPDIYMVAVILALFMIHVVQQEGVDYLNDKKVARAHLMTCYVMQCQLRTCTSYGILRGESRNLECVLLRSGRVHICPIGATGANSRHHLCDTSVGSARSKN